MEAMRANENVRYQYLSLSFLNFLRWLKMLQFVKSIHIKYSAGHAKNSSTL